MNVILVACQLIPLEKSLGVRPIGVDEVLRRIIGEAIMTVLKFDIININSYQQLRAGLELGCEVVVHAVLDLLKKMRHMGSFRKTSETALIR